MKYFFTAFFSLISIHISAQMISFTFDDGSVKDQPNYTFEEWNTMLLDKLEKADIEAMFFINGKNKINEKGKKLLQSWNARGHKIANHTFEHLNYSKDTHSFEAFKNDFIKNDSLINSYSNYVKFFRYPYLKEGNTEEKIDSARTFLKSLNYRNGYVTIDASDWYIDSRLCKRLKEDPNADISEYRAYYLDHLWRYAQFYEKIASELHGRHIKHTLLLHHNLSAALFIDDLIKMFKNKGWKIVPITEAYEDSVYIQTPIFAGESLIYAQAIDTGEYDNTFRKPGEDSAYEKEKMAKLGL